MRIEDLRQRQIDGWDSISAVLDDLVRHRSEPWADGFRDRVGRGIAFITFAYDIDGVSMEIAKYGRCFERMLPGVPIHCIAGNFGDKADVILDPSWQRFRLPGADGWDKWDGGRWFARLFYEDLPPRSERSSELAREMWRQGLALAEPLAAYIKEREVGLLFPVNTNSNPGNVAFALAIILAAEATGSCVLNNNHDFFWEGGKASCKRKPGEEPGPRDHFFRNHSNEEFFSVFERFYPWNGHHWVQVNINPLQVRRLIDRYHFRPDRVFTIGTGLDPEFFRMCTPEKKRECRRRMAHVLGGAAVIEPIPVALFQMGLEAWMADQCASSTRRRRTFATKS